MIQEISVDIVTQYIHFYRQVLLDGNSTLVQISAKNGVNEVEWSKSWRQKCWYIFVEIQLLDDGENYTRKNRLAALDIDPCRDYDNEPFIANYQVIGVLNDQTIDLQSNILIPRNKSLRVIGFGTVTNGRFEASSPFDCVNLYDDVTQEIFTANASHLKFNLLPLSAK